jgi:aconitase A
VTASATDTAVPLAPGAARARVWEGYPALDGTQRKVNVTLRIDTPIEVDYYVDGGILPYVLRQLLVA